MGDSRVYMYREKREKKLKKGKKQIFRGPDRFIHRRVRTAG
jgi:hypothetical protein